MSPIRQRTPEWHSLRRESITSTDIPVILGLSPYRSEGSLARQKLGTPDPEEPDPARERAMRIGLLLEDIIRAEDQLEHGIRLQRVNQVLTHPSIPWARTSLDFRRLGKPRTIVEAKSSRSSRWGDELPRDIESQVRWQMGVARYPFAHVAALKSGSELACYDLEHDEDTFAGLVDIAADFRRRLDEGGPFSENLASLKARYPSDDGSEMTADADLEEAARAFLDVRDAIGDLEAKKDALQVAIGTRMAEAAFLRGDGWHIIFRREKDATSVDWKCIADTLLEPMSEADRALYIAGATTTKPGKRPFKAYRERGEGEA